MCKRLLLVSKMCRNMVVVGFFFCDRKSWSWFVCSVRYLASATVGSGDWSDLLFPRNNFAFNDCSQLFFVTPPLRFSWCLFGLVATSFLVVSKGFDLWFLDYLSDVWHEACRWSWSCFPRSNLGCFYLLTVYIILLMLGSRTNRNCLPNDGSFYFGGIVVSTSLFPNSGRSA